MMEETWLFRSLSNISFEIQNQESKQGRLATKFGFFLSFFRYTRNWRRIYGTFGATCGSMLTVAVFVWGGDVTFTWPFSANFLSTNISWAASGGPPGLISCPLLSLWGKDGPGDDLACPFLSQRGEEEERAGADLCSFWEESTWRGGIWRVFSQSDGRVEVSVWMGSFGPAEDRGTEETAAWTVELWEAAAGGGGGEEEGEEEDCFTYRRKRKKKNQVGRQYEMKAKEIIEIT